jgi:hypothetical protein
MMETDADDEAETSSEVPSIPRAFGDTTAPAIWIA